jgi:nitroreductase
MASSMFGSQETQITQKQDIKFMTDPLYPSPSPAGFSPEQLHTVVDWAIVSRRCVRAFLPTPVPRATIERLLAVASRAPSGSNTQPWKVYVFTGAAQQRLSQEILNAYNDPALAATHSREYSYYPNQWVSPYLDRRRKLGWDLYGLLGIGRGDKAKMHAQLGRNYRFFDAPVGLIFTIDRILERGSWLDFGMFLQNLMLAARGHGLDTCPQAAFIQFHRIIEAQLELPAAEMVVCGMSLGHADQSKIDNSLRTEREPVSGFARSVEE